MRVWDVATARIRKESPGSRRILPLADRQPGRPAGGRDGVRPADQKHHLHVCDIASGERLFSVEGKALAYSPDGRWLAALAADDTTVLLLDARTHETAARFSRP